MAIFRGSYTFLYGLESYPRPFICTHVTTASQRGWALRYAVLERVDVPRKKFV
jgi:hypothetical protein